MRIQGNPTSAVASVNSLRSSNAYMRPWTKPSLYQIRLVAESSEPLLRNFNCTPKNHWNLNRNSNSFIHEMEFENDVWMIAAILWRRE